MSEFFNSEIIQEELVKINQLQEEVYKNAFTFESMDREERLDHIDNLTDLLEMQQVMYTRLSLSDDPAAKKMKEQLEKSVQLLGFPEGTDISVLFNGMNNTIDKLKQIAEG
jgi:sorbitol-specific phosphotransferase system component IIBC